jgi:hypothetical protein
MSRNHWRVGIGLLLLCLGSSVAFAGKEIYAVGGLNLANAGGDADLLGAALGTGLESQVGGTWISNKKMRTAFDGGIGFSFTGAGIMGGAVEVHYAARGLKWDFLETSGSGALVKTTMRLNYVEVPILLQITPESSGSVRPVFVLGPVVGFRASSNFVVESGGSVDLSSGMKSTYFGGVAGVGMRVRTVGGSAFLLQARFLMGFSNLIDDPTVKIRPQDFAILAGYSIGL